MSATFRLPSEISARTAMVGLVGTVLAAAVGLASSVSPAGAMAVPALAALVALWRRPWLGLAFMLGAAVVIDQYTYALGGRKGIFVSSIPFFRSVGGATPAEGVLFLLLVVWLMKSAQSGERLFPRTVIAACLALVLAFVAVYTVVGVARGGSLNFALSEIRPFVYLGITYLLTAAWGARANVTRILAWALVLGCGFRGLYGIRLWLVTRSMSPRPEAILSHEESFFFGLFIVLTAALWLWGAKGRLTRVATALLPFVFLSDLANSRRTAWAVLAFGLVLLWVVALRRLPRRRRMLVWMAPCVVACSVVYFPVFWNRPSTLGQPARALRSTIAPDARDKSSDSYRSLERQNLYLNISDASYAGAGFGIPIDYKIKIVDLTGISIMLKYVPHNNVLWLWLRMGLFGALAFWALLGAGFIKAAQLTKLTGLDDETALLGTMTVVALAAYMIMGYQDLGFSWFRIAVFMGGLLGALDGRSRALELRSVPVIGATACAPGPPAPISVTHQE